MTLTVLRHNDLGNLDPDAEDIEDYEKAERQEKKDYIENKYNVKLEFVDVPTDDWDNIPTEIVNAYTAGSPVADIMDVYYQFAGTYVANDILYDMSEDFASTDLFRDNAIFNWTGKSWGLTHGIGGEGLYYNAEMISKAGMEYTPAEMFDMGKWDYDSCYDYLVELKSKLGEDEYPLFVSPYYWMLFGSGANGVTILNSDGNLNYLDPAFLESCEFIQKLINEGLCAKGPATEDGGWDTWSYPGSTFDAGNTIAIAHRAAWQASAIVGNFEMGYVPYPWGSNVTIDESQIGTSGAYLTLSDNYDSSYYDGQALCITKGVDSKVGKENMLGLEVMLCEWMGWEDLLTSYEVVHDSSECTWLEDGLDKDLYFFARDRERVELFNSIDLDFSLAASDMMYNNTGIRSTLQSFYQADMALMIEAGFASNDVYDDTVE